MHVRRKLLSFGLSAVVGMICSILPGQSPSASRSGSFDTEIPIPSSTGLLGNRDVNALNEVVQHLKTVGTAPWRGMEGQGQITYGASNSLAYTATLSMVGGDRFRLDAATATNPISIRMHRRAGQVQGPDGKLSPIPQDTAVFGLVQFELPRLQDFPKPAASLTEKESVSLDGSVFHRVTYEFSPSDKAAGRTIVTDLYFDTNTHLLVKTATSILLKGIHNNKLLQVMTYGDYRKVDSALVPFRYRQTLDGQLQWTLQLNAVQLNPALDETFFEF